MGNVGIDVQRLGQEAGVLGGQAQSATSIKSSLDSGVATATGACGTVPDGGLKQALQNFLTAWQYDTAAVASDVQSTSSAMQALASLYEQADVQGADAMG